MIFSFVCITPAFAQNYFDPVPPSELGCLEREWGQINPTEADKKFDIENDFDKYGERISCKNFITPTELNNFFTKMKKAVQHRDKEAVADLIPFPIRSSLDGMEDVPEGSRAKSRSRNIKNKQEFIESYDDIMLPTTIKIVQCLQLDNMMAHPNQGPATTLGEIWFYRDFDTRKLSIYRLSSSPEEHKHWLDKECSW